MTDGPIRLMRALVLLSIGPLHVQCILDSLLWPHLTAWPLHQNKPTQEPWTQKASGEAHPNVDPCTHLGATSSGQANASEHRPLALCIFPRGGAAPRTRFAKPEPNGSSAAEVPFVNHFDLDAVLVCDCSWLLPKNCDCFDLKNAGFP